MTNARTIGALAAAAATLVGLVAATVTNKPIPLSPEEQRAAERRAAEKQRIEAERVAKEQLEQKIAAIEARQAATDARARRYAIAGWVSIVLPFIGWGIAGLVLAFTLAPLIVITAAPIVIGIGLHIAAAAIARKGRKRFNAELAELQR